MLTTLFNLSLSQPVAYCKLAQKKYDYVTNFLSFLIFNILFYYFAAIFSVRSKTYIDVWPVNFLNPGENDSFDTTSLFMMQLACIVNMVPLWSKLKLRVCVCDEARTSYFAFDSSTQSHGEKLENLLKKLRIEAELFPVNGWKNVIESHGNENERYAKR